MRLVWRERRVAAPRRTNIFISVLDVDVVAVRLLGVVSWRVEDLGLASGEVVGPVAQDRPLVLVVARIADRQQHRSHCLVHELRKPEVEGEAAADDTQPPGGLQRVGVAVPVRDRQQYKRRPQRQKDHEHDPVLLERHKPVEEGEDAPQKEEAAHKRPSRRRKSVRVDRGHCDENGNRPPERAIAEENHVAKGGAFKKQ